MKRGIDLDSCRPGNDKKNHLCNPATHQKQEDKKEQKNGCPIFFMDKSNRPDDQQDTDTNGGNAGQ